MLMTDTASRRYIRIVTATDVLSTAKSVLRGDDFSHGRCFENASWLVVTVCPLRPEALAAYDDDFYPKNAETLPQKAF